MKKKIASLIMILTVFLVMAVTVSAKEWTSKGDAGFYLIDGNWTFGAHYTIGTSATVDSSRTNNLSGDVCFPSYVQFEYGNGDPRWLYISSAYLYDCDSVTSITGPNEGDYIGISDCDNLKKVIVKGGKDTYIEFYDCPALETLVLPEGMVTLYGEVYNCPNLKNVNLPDSLTKIYNGIFDGSAIEKISIPPQMNKITNGLFYECANLKTITIPDAITEIGSYAFYGCTSLTDVYYGGSLQMWEAISKGSNNDALKNATIHCSDVESGSCGENVSWRLSDEGELKIFGSGAMTDFVTTDEIPWYGYKNNIKKLIIEDGITHIGANSFYNSPNLADVTMADSVETIGRWAFNYCRKLTTVEIPPNVTSIGIRAFYNCSALQSITIPQNTTSIAEKAFYNCTALSDVCYAGSDVDWNGITIDDGNEPLLNAEIDYDYVEPTPVPTPAPTVAPIVLPDVVPISNGSNIVKVNANDVDIVRSVYILNIGNETTYTYKGAAQMKKDGQANGLNPAAGIETLTNPWDGTRLELERAGNYVAVISYLENYTDAKEKRTLCFFSVAEDIIAPYVIQKIDGSSAVNFAKGKTKTMQPAWIIAIGDETEYSYTSWEKFVADGKANGLNPVAGYGIGKSGRFAAANTGNHVAIISYVDRTGFTHRIQRMFNVDCVQEAPTITLENNVFKLNRNGAVSVSAAYAMNIGEETDYTYTSWSEYVAYGKANGLNTTSGCEFYTVKEDGTELVPGKPGNYVVVIRYELDNGETFVIQQPGVLVVEEGTKPTIDIDGSTFTLNANGLIVENVYLMNSQQRDDFTYKTFANFAAFGKSASFGAYNPKNGYDYFKSVENGATYEAKQTGYYNTLIRYKDAAGNSRMIFEKYYVE